MKSKAKKIVAAIAAMTLSASICMCAGCNIGNNTADVNTNTDSKTEQTENTENNSADVNTNTDSKTEQTENTENKSDETTKDETPATTDKTSTETVDDASADFAEQQIKAITLDCEVDYTDETEWTESGRSESTTDTQAIKVYGGAVVNDNGGDCDLVVEKTADNETLYEYLYMRNGNMFSSLSELGSKITDVSELELKQYGTLSDNISFGEIVSNIVNLVGDNADDLKTELYAPAVIGTKYDAVTISSTSITLNVNKLLMGVFDDIEEAIDGITSTTTLTQIFELTPFTVLLSLYNYGLNVNEMYDLLETQKDDMDASYKEIFELLPEPAETDTYLSYIKTLLSNTKIKEYVEEQGITVNGTLGDLTMGDLIKVISGSEEVDTDEYLSGIKTEIKEKYLDNVTATESSFKVETSDSVTSSNSSGSTSDEYTFEWESTESLNDAQIVYTLDSGKLTQIDIDGNYVVEYSQSYTNSSDNSTESMDAKTTMEISTTIGIDDSYTVTDISNAKVVCGVDIKDIDEYTAGQWITKTDDAEDTETADLTVSVKDGYITLKTGETALTSIYVTDDRETIPSGYGVDGEDEVDEWPIYFAKNNENINLTIYVINNKKINVYASTWVYDTDGNIIGSCWTEEYICIDCLETKTSTMKEYLASLSD